MDPETNTPAPQSQPETLPQAFPPKNKKAEVIILAIVAVVIIAAVLVIFFWLHNHSSNSTNGQSNAGKTASSSQSKATGIYAGWESNCDFASGSCFYYPSTWKAQNGANNSGMTITNKTSTAAVYESPTSTSCQSNQSPSTVNVYVVSVSPLSTPNSNLEIVGGYFSSKLNGSSAYNPEYVLTNTSYINKYGVSTGSTVAFPNDWGCYTYGVDYGEASAQPVGINSYNSSTQDASSWFATADAKTSLEILQSVHLSS